MAVGDDDDEVWRIALQEFLDFGGANFLGLVHGDVCDESRFLHAREGNFVAASAGAVRLGDDGYDFEVWLSEKMVKAGNGKLRSAAEEEAHKISPMK